jgi:hypothetical protein
MCFSATASFVAAGSLAAIGTATIKKAQHRSELPFATIPLLFGIQQTVGLDLVFLLRDPERAHLHPSEIPRARGLSPRAGSGSFFGEVGHMTSPYRVAFDRAVRPS